MTERVTPDHLRDLGENVTNVANEWAGAENYLARGLIEWTRRLIGDNQQHAVRAALAACEVVAKSPLAVGAEENAVAQAPAHYVDKILDTIRAWLADPSKENQDAARLAFDFTRELHAWQGYEHLPHFWVREAVDHACLAVWAGLRASYIAPLDYATCAARSVACVYHALVAGEQKPSDEQIAKAVTTVTNAVRGR